MTSISIAGGRKISPRSESIPLPRIAFYTIGDRQTPSTWFRVIQYLPALARCGWGFRHFELPSPVGSGIMQSLGIFWQGAVRFSQLREARDYDILFVQKGLTSWRCRGLVDSLRSANKPYVVDIDDAVYLTEFSVQFPSFLQKLQNDAEPIELLRHASHVITGNSFLAAFAQKYNSRVTLIPTPIDTERFSISSTAATSGDGKVVLGWSGSAGTNFYFNLLAPVFAELAKKYPLLKIRVISNTKNRIELSKFEGVRLEFVSWRREREVEDLGKIDIGVMPLEDNEWARGKCGFKALLYMALGIPPVCSAVGVNTEIIEDGVNGFLAHDHEEWIEKLSRLIENPDLRKKMGLAARKTVEEKYSLAVNMPKWFGVLKTVLERGA